MSVKINNDTLEFVYSDFVSIMVGLILTPFCLFGYYVILSQSDFRTEFVPVIIGMLFLGIFLLGGLFLLLGRSGTRISLPEKTVNMWSRFLWRKKDKLVQFNDCQHIRVYQTRSKKEVRVTNVGLVIAGDTEKYLTCFQSAVKARALAEEVAGAMQLSLLDETVPGSRLIKYDELDLNIRQKYEKDSELVNAAAHKEEDSSGLQRLNKGMDEKLAGISASIASEPGSPSSRISKPTVMRTRLTRIGDGLILEMPPKGLKDKLGLSLLALFTFGLILSQLVERIVNGAQMDGLSVSTMPLISYIGLVVIVGLPMFVNRQKLTVNKEQVFYEEKGCSFKKVMIKVEDIEFFEAVHVKQFNKKELGQIYIRSKSEEIKYAGLMTVEEADYLAELCMAIIIRK